MQKQSLPIMSKLEDLQSGEKIYTVELVVEDNKNVFSFTEFTFIKYLDKKIHIEGIEINENSIIAQLKDERFKNTEIKTDISCGFFLSKKEAVEEFNASIYELMIKTKLAYDEFMKAC